MFSAIAAPTGLAPVERRLLHQKRRTPGASPPPSLSRWGEGFCIRRVVPPSLSCPQASAPPRQARWGLGPRRAALLVQKPSPHRDKLGGGGFWGAIQARHLGTTWRWPSS